MITNLLLYCVKHRDSATVRRYCFVTRRRYCRAGVAELDSSPDFTFDSLPFVLNLSLIQVVNVSPCLSRWTRRWVGPIKTAWGRNGPHHSS